MVENCKNIGELTKISDFYISRFMATIKSFEELEIWKEARRFAGPLPFTFTYSPEKKKVLIIEGVRENWKPNPVHIIEHKFSFTENLKLNGIKLANAAFEIHLRLRETDSKGAIITTL